MRNEEGGFGSRDDGGRPPRQGGSRPRQGGFKPREGGFRPPRQMHKAVCATCQKECEVPFQPREGRPVYCRECFQK